MCFTENPESPGRRDGVIDNCSDNDGNCEDDCDSCKDSLDGCDLRGSVDSFDNIDYKCGG